jgi:8-hydroxy-5-deazaflavin:NADPH oxidoreductase
MTSIHTVGFIGSGMIGSALARLAVAAGLDVVLSNSHGPQSLAELVAELGDRAQATSPADSALAGDIVVATIPFHAYQELPVDTVARKTVIDTMNYYPDRDGGIAQLDAGIATSSSLVQEHLPRSQVVKAFNNVDFRRLFSLARPSGASDRSALPIASDYGEAKEQAVLLLDLLGYDAVDIGALADSWRSEPGTPVYVQPYLPQRPAGMTPELAQHWFFETPGVTVPASRVRELTAAAVRS